MTFKEMYVTAFRLRTDAFTLDGVPQQPRAGWITRNMACPWQADFLKCASEGTGTWWPAQRPIDVFVESPNGPRRVQWVQGIGNHKDLVARHQLLGFVQRVQVAGNEVLIERERDDNLPR